MKEIITTSALVAQVLKERHTLHGALLVLGQWLSLLAVGVIYLAGVSDGNLTDSERYLGLAALVLHVALTFAHWRKS